MNKQPTTPLKLIFVAICLMVILAAAGLVSAQEEGEDETIPTPSATATPESDDFESGDAETTGSEITEPAQTLPPTPVSPLPVEETDSLPPLPGTFPLPPNGVGELTLSFADINESEFSLSADGSSETVSFSLPRFIQPLPGATIDLDYETQTNATDQIPQLDISFNDVGQISSINVNNSVTQTRSSINLGDLVTTRENNRLSLLLNNQVGCNEVRPEVLARIFDTSTFNIPYQLLPMQPNLGDYPWPFVDRGYRPAETYIVLPQNPSAADMSAAATVSAGLGKSGAQSIVITSTVDSSVTDEIRQNYNLIVIGEAGQNSLLDELTLPLALDNRIIQPDYGIIQELQSPWNPYRMVLVLSGQSEQGLARASQALNRNIQFPGMSGPVAIVQDVLPPVPLEGQQREIDLTFNSLDYEDQVVYGAHRGSLRVDFFLPQSFELIEAPQAFISFNHSQLVDPVSSSMDVLLNGVPVGATVLDESNVVNGLLQVELPTWQLESGRNRLEIQLEMHFGANDDECLTAGDRRLWTVVRSDSFIRLPYQAQELQPDLSLFPYPYDQDVNLDNLALVVPPRPNVTELQAITDLAVNLGQAAAGGYISLDVLTADNVSPQDLATQHTILIGRPSRNEILRAINSDLPQPFVPDSDLLDPVLDTVILLPDPDQNVGLIQQVSLADEYYTLVLSGTTDQGLASAVAALNNGRLGKGDVAIIKDVESLASSSVSVKISPHYASLENLSQNRVLPVSMAGSGSVGNSSKLVALSKRWW